MVIRRYSSIFKLKIFFRLLSFYFHFSKTVMAFTLFLNIFDNKGFQLLIYKIELVLDLLYLPVI